MGRIGSATEGARPTYKTSTENVYGGAPMPNLENLKKQAKQFLRWHRDRYFPVAGRIRESLPRFGHLDDAEILAHAFKLSDAQELVARQHGFANWEALKRGLSTASEPSSTSSTGCVITATAAQLFVTDIKRSSDFFVQKLGFSIVFTYGEPPFYAQVRREQGLLNLRHVDQPVIDPGLRERESLLSADLGVGTSKGIKQLFLEFQAADVDFFQTLRREPWGAQTFIIKDPDGNLVLFAGPLN